MSTRRLPVYLLLDCSESMAGPAIEDVQRGLDTLYKSLRSDPQALEMAYISVITFSRYAKQVVPLTDVVQFQPPKLTVQAGTALGSALDLLRIRLEKEVVKNSPTVKGDFKPLVFLLTDGQPTDDWEPAAQRLRAANSTKIANIYAIGCGPDADVEILRSITDIVLTMPEMDAESIRKVFVWLSQSTSAASTRFGSGNVNTPMEAPPLPEGLEIAPASSGYGLSRRNERPRQVFLQSRCSRTRSPYLMRFARQGNRYVAIAAHKLDLVEEGDDELMPTINSSELDGCPDCPYCSNPVAAVCDCGAIFCDNPTVGTSVTCPGCKSTLHRSNASSGSFDIKRSQG